ncbi:MAG: hypothetical protein GY719_25695 [bacterium]|nr:hypothetical protein [bacterium]
MKRVAYLYALKAYHNRDGVSLALVRAESHAPAVTRGQEWAKTLGPGWAWWSAEFVDEKCLAAGELLEI